MKSHKRRLCGLRLKGAVYHEVDYGDLNTIFELCPPIPVNPTDIGLAAQGVALIWNEERQTYDIWDQIGASHYPHAVDWKEETRHKGLSRRIPISTDVSKLSQQSRHIVVHPLGAILDPSPFHAKRVQWPEGVRCPKEHAQHLEPNDTLKKYAGVEMNCAGMHWECVDGRPAKGRLMTREAPGYAFQVAVPPKGIRPEFTYAIIAQYPVSHFVLINGAPQDTDQRAVDLLNTLGGGLEGHWKREDE